MGLESISFNELLKSLRKAKGYTLTQLAELSGVSRPYLSQIESGKKGVPSIQVINSLAKVLNVNSLVLAWKAGYYSDEEYYQWKKEQEFFDSMSPEEFDEYIERQQKEYLIYEYERENLPDLKEILERNELYFNKIKLDNKQKETVLGILEVLFRDSPPNYPTQEEIERRFEDQFKLKENIRQLIEKNEK